MPNEIEMSDLERCARAAYDLEWADHGSESDFEDGKDYWLKSTRAVLSALIPPSEGTIKVGCSEYCLDDPKEYPSPSGIGDAFTAMIQHILNEGK